MSEQMSSSVIELTQRYGLYTYLVMVGVSAVYGGTKGFCKWTNWLQRRKRVTINQELIDPILNIGRDGGYMGYYILAGGGLSAFITASFPVSIPALSWMAKEVDGSQGVHAD
jgi:hypothetical protein